jgi:broad specificity phosphatase PhoE
VTVDARLVLVRHGVTDWNREGRWQGRLDPPLSDEGRHEAELAAERIAADPTLRPARIVSSTLRRAIGTAERIGAAVDVAVEGDARLMEIGAGEWEGRTHAELEEIDGERYHAWRAQENDVRPPGGEPLDDAIGRCRELLDELARGSGPWPTLLVSHGGSMRILANLLLELPGAWMWNLDVDNASISVVARYGTQGRWRVERWNDTLHLLGVETTHVDEAEGRPLAL